MCRGRMAEGIVLRGGTPSPQIFVRLITHPWFTMRSWLICLPCAEPVLVQPFCSFPDGMSLGLLHGALNWAAAIGTVMGYVLLRGLD